MRLDDQIPRPAEAGAFAYTGFVAGIKMLAKTPSNISGTEVLRGKTVVGKYLSVEPYGIMMRRDEPQLERIVNRALNEPLRSGDIRRVYARWFSTNELTVPLNQYLKEAFAVPNTYPAWP